MRRQVGIEERMKEVRAQPAVTLDGQRVLLAANMEEVEDVKAVLECGAEGIGLFRTEYLFLDRSHLPSEEEQTQAYRTVAAALKPHPVVIRTLDLGGDKLLTGDAAAQEVNPFLGRRSIRLCLQERELFAEQLRAILRASVEGNVKLMYPMISGLAELKAASVLLEQCKTQLRGRGIPFDENLEVGAMIEVPSAAVVADTLARHLKFFSIGSNDLIQYTLAVDRLNESIAHMYEPTHPAILRLIKMTVDAAHNAGIWVGVCGEIAGDPDLVPLLLGLGVDELSATPPLVPKVKFLIRRLTQNETSALAEFALKCESPAEILANSKALARQAAPDLFNTDLMSAP
jgi:phosphotransferase system enzyme I (PtsI)